jgi:hypothetical protein
VDEQEDKDRQDRQDGDHLQQSSNDELQHGPKE